MISLTMVSPKPSPAFLDVWNGSKSVANWAASIPEPVSPTLIIKPVPFIPAEMRNEPPACRAPACAPYGADRPLGAGRPGVIACKPF